MNRVVDPRIGQSLVNAALRLDAARAAQRFRPGAVPTVSMPQRRPQFVCTPRAGMSACNVFDLTTASVVQVPPGVTVPAWQGPPRGAFGGGPTIQIRLPNGHYAIAYTQDFVRVQADRVGQGLVSAALRLRQANDTVFRPQQASTTRVPDLVRSRAPAPGPSVPERFYGDAIVIAPDGVNVWQAVSEAGRMTWRFLTNLPRFSVALIERSEGPFVYVRYNPRGEGYASFLHPTTGQPNFQKVNRPDRVGQSLVSAALQLDAARRAEALRRAELPTPPPPFDPARERRPGEGGTLSIPDPSAPRPRLSPVEAAMRLSRALDRFGIPHGRVQVTHPRGVQIWTHPQGEYRPGTGIPLMDRLVVLPQGAILTVQPDPAMTEAALNSPERFGMGFHSFTANWNLRDVDQRMSPASFERLGVPTNLLRGQGFIAGTMADRLLPLHRRGGTVPT